MTSLLGAHVAAHLAQTTAVASARHKSPTYHFPWTDGLRAAVARLREGTHDEPGVPKAKLGKTLHRPGRRRSS